ncbi:transcriptional regulator (plasmid) [Calothrix sp. PCC 7716]|nr:transcriptional regulator [Calothrix sp. PCC 7716]
MKNIGKAIKLLRQTHNLKASEFAKVTGLSKSYISEIENGYNNPSLDKLSVIAKALSINVSEIFLIAEQLDNPRIINENTTIANVIHPKLLAIMNIVKEVKQ